MRAKARKAFVVHHREHVMAALQAASEAGAAITLLSPPAAALSLGAAVFAAMIEDARLHYPGVDAVAVLDCADRPGMALNALRHGVKAIRLAASPEIISKINEITAQTESKLELRDIPACDLNNVEDLLTSCRKWLQSQ